MEKCHKLLRYGSGISLSVMQYEIKLYLIPQWWSDVFWFLWVLAAGRVMPNSILFFTL